MDDHGSGRTDGMDARGARPEDRPVDPDAVARFERLDPGAERLRMPVPKAAARPARNNLVTTAGVILVVLGVFVATATVLLVLPSDDSASTVALYLALAALYAIVGVLVLRRVRAGRMLGFGVGALAMAVGLVQLPSAGLNGVPTVVVAGFIIYALAIGGHDFRRG